MGAVSVREPSQEEFLKVAAFSFERFVNETAKSTEESPSSVREKLGSSPTEISRNDIWLLVEVDQKKIGFIWVKLKADQKYAFGYDIYLDPAFRSQGIGRNVMKQCGERLKKLGIESVEICVFEHNEIARKLYASLGFKTKKFDESRKQFVLALSLVQTGI